MLFLVDRRITAVLQSAVPASAVTIANFEFTFYWHIIVSTPVLAGNTPERIRHRYSARLENGTA
jgi:hypothetical protein